MFKVSFKEMLEKVFKDAWLGGAGSFSPSLLVVRVPCGLLGVLSGSLGGPLRASWAPVASSWCDFGFSFGAVLLVCLEVFLDCLMDQLPDDLLLGQQRQ